jgi:hypothetical protein
MTIAYADFERRVRLRVLVFAEPPTVWANGWTGA